MSSAFKPVKKFKISIRLSILILFFLILSLTGFSLISIQYITLNKMLSTSAKTMINLVSLLIKEHFKIYLLPFSHKLIEIKNMIDNSIISPEDGSQFDRFLIEIIKSDPEIFMVYYGTVEGDFYGVDREKKDVIGLNHILNSKHPPQKIRYELDKNGKIIKSYPLKQMYDPRVRPWYNEAIQMKKPILTDIYKFYVFEKGGYIEPGITATAPIYDKNHKVKGAIALDLTINRLQNFLQNLDLTKNTIMYIINQNNEVIAYQDDAEQTDIRGQKIPDRVSGIITTFLPTLVSKMQNSLVGSFKKNNQEYFMDYEVLPIIGSNGQTEQFWKIIIIVPSQDILEALRDLIFRTLLLALFVLLLGFIFIRYVSKKISQPITQLTEDAKKIAQLDLTSRPPLNTVIKEICDLDEALMIMRSSLESFQRYVPRSLVKQLIRSGKIAEVGGENRQITVLFTDIRNFTHLAEIISPKKLMHALSDYFQMVTEIIINHQGTLDKYIGDAVMALWGAPLMDSLQAPHACQTAKSMIEQLDKFNKKKKHSELPPFSIRIGIHSGKAIIGNVGSEDRLNYTALGDTVNLASRLESLNKFYQTHIIVSEAVYQQVKILFPFRLLDEVAVRGKEVSHFIYELIVEKNIGDLKKHHEEFIEAFNCYQQGLWEQSIKFFEQMTPAYSGDPLPMIYINRCKNFQNDPPKIWNGVWKAY